MIQILHFSEPFMRRFLSYFATLIRREHWWAEFWCALVAMAWGLLNMALTPEKRFDTAFQFLAGLAPAIAWEQIAILTGLCQMIALIVDQNGLRTITAMAQGFLFAVIAISACYGGGFFPNMPLYFGYVGMNAFAIARNGLSAERARIAKVNGN